MSSTSNDLDLSNDPPLGEVDKFEVRPYDSRPQEDSARRRIAYILLGILGFVLLWAIISVSCYPNLTDNIIKILQIILGPIIALVSAATGFYFGSKTNP